MNKGKAQRVKDPTLIIARLFYCKHIDIISDMETDSKMTHAA